MHIVNGCLNATNAYSSFADIEGSDSEINDKETGLPAHASLETDYVGEPENVETLVRTVLPTPHSLISS